MAQDDERKKKITILAFLSILVFICGLLILISSIIIGNNNGNISTDFIPSDIGLTRNIGLSFLWFAAIVCFAVAIVGAAVYKFDQRCLIIVFGSGLGTTSLIVFIIGCVFAFQSIYLPSAIATLCQDKNTPQFQPFMKGSYLDTNMLYAVNRYMCTSDCPCDSATYNNGYASVTEETLNYHGRTASNTPQKLAITTTTVNGLTSWEQCWNTTIKASTSNNTSIVESMDTYLGIMRALEPLYQCSAACQPALFWFTEPISTKPVDGCLNKVSNQYAGTYAFPGWACIVASIIMCLIFVFQYSLWSRDEPATEEQKQTSQE